MTDELEIIDIATEEEAALDDGAAGPESRGRPRGRRGRPSAEARRARRRAAAGVLLTVGVLGVLVAGAYASWAVASVRHIDRLLAEATALDRGILEAEATWTDRLLPEEEVLRTDFEAELGQARADLRALAEEIGSTRSPPDTRVAAYRDAAADAIRDAAAGSTTSRDVLDGDVDTPLADHPDVKQARAAGADRWPLLSPLTTTDEREQVLSRALRERLPDPDILFAGDCGCRLRALGGRGSSSPDATTFDFRGSPHRREIDTPSSEEVELLRRRSLPWGAFDLEAIRELGLHALGGELTMPLRDGGVAPLPAGSILVAANDDVAVLLDVPDTEPRGHRLVAVDRDDGRRSEMATAADRLLEVGDHHVLIADDGRGDLWLVDTQTMRSRRWNTIPTVMRIEGASMSPDGSQVAVSGVGRLGWAVAVVAHGDPQILMTPDGGYGTRVHGPKWTADGQWVFWLQHEVTPMTYRWIRGARADGSAGPFTVRAAGHYRAVTPLAS